MQSLDQEILDQLTVIAKQRGISVQELIRAIIIPDWLEKQGTAKRTQNKNP
jgi:hypothetical protein